MAELLIGCGNSRRKKLTLDENWQWQDLTTLDHDPNCGADIIHDLEETPWPVASDTYDEIHAYEVLEHIGAQGDYRAFFAQFAEIYRALKPGGLFMGTVPDWRGVWAWGDPSHRRVIQPESLIFLDQAVYRERVGKSAMTDFRWLWKGDLELVAAETVEETFKFALQAHKPARG